MIFVVNIALKICIKYSRSLTRSSKIANLRIMVQWQGHERLP
ncbi:hypothetical protein Desor_5217 [Desulfosporosinus orientis DSM 765]|uniref:Uncharacterized protein n=1 Tax=Desulfosporosinus orientis (strain ATCC 19365 / DSM 765 / NCIMB 8382 / VKM B-1628 / Singapore I) TaxID=768706 RepID=G7W793_DESOD|nr:hypothetical protein Desor_5217 [Desulfosporosinus orientis DSM 765]